MDLFKSLLALVDGKKTYLLVAVLFVLVLINGGDPAAQDWNAMLTDPQRIMEAIGVLLLGTFRSALDKLIKS